MENKENKNKFSADSILGDIIKVPEAYEILKKYGVPCITCPMMAYELNSLKLGDISKMYGVDLKELLEELQKIK